MLSGLHGILWYFMGRVRNNTGRKEILNYAMISSPVEIDKLFR